MYISDSDIKEFLNDVVILARGLVEDDHVSDVQFVHVSQGVEIARYTDFSAAVLEACSMNDHWREHCARCAESWEPAADNEVFVFCEIVFSSGSKIVFPVDLVRALNKKGDDADA